MEALRDGSGAHPASRASTTTKADRVSIITPPGLDSAPPAGGLPVVVGVHARTPTRPEDVEAHRQRPRSHPGTKCSRAWRAERLHIPAFRPDAPPHPRPRSGRRVARSSTHPTTLSRVTTRTIGRRIPHAFASFIILSSIFSKLSSTSFHLPQPFRICDTGGRDPSQDAEYVCLQAASINIKNQRQQSEEDTSIRLDSQRRS